MPRDSAAEPAPDRLVSLDAYRGFTMLAMASGGLGLMEVARRNPRWLPLGLQFELVVPGDAVLVVDPDLKEPAHPEQGDDQ